MWCALLKFVGRRGADRYADLRSDAAARIPIGTPGGKRYKNFPTTTTFQGALAYY